MPLQRGFDSFYGFVTGSIDMFTKESFEGCDSTYHTTEQCYTDFYDQEVRIQEQRRVTR
jgi:hypothetical protein